MDRAVPHRAGGADDDHADRRGAVLEAAARPGSWGGELLDRQPHRVVGAAGHGATLGDGSEPVAERALCRGAAARRAARAAQRAGGGRIDRWRQPLAGVLAHHPAVAASLYLGGTAAAHDLRVPRVRQYLRDDQRRTGERDDDTVDVHLSCVVRAVRPEPGRGRVMADAADLPAAVSVLHRGDPPPRGELMSALSGVGSRRSKLVFAGSVYLALIAMTAVFLFPLLWVIGLSLKTRLQVFANPPLFVWWPTLENYVGVLGQADFLQAFVNSLVVSSGAVLLSICVGVPAAYAFARFPFRGGSFLFFSLLVMRMLPPIAVLVPMYILFSKFGLTTTRLSVVLAYSTFSLPLVVWIMRGFFEDLPRELEESAWVDGASRYAAFRHVVLPLIRPGLVAASILCLQLAWNDFLFAAVLTNNATRTLPVLMAGFSGGDTGVDWGGMTASGALVILPVLIFSFAAQRHLVAGLSSGAVKG